jgi:uncharacterized protein YjiS (DUF1127 family)
VQSLFAVGAPAVSLGRAEATEKTHDDDFLSRRPACIPKFRSNFLYWIGPFARKLGARSRLTYWARREAIKVLGGMDDRALRDIGIARSQIEAAVGGALNPGMARLR